MWNYWYFLDQTIYYMEQNAQNILVIFLSRNFLEHDRGEGRLGLVSWDTDISKIFLSEKQRSRYGTV